jgi:hypothetical protein
MTEEQIFIHLLIDKAIMNFNTIARLFVLTAILALPLMVFAQPSPPAGGTPPCGEPFGPVCPIDGGVSLLVAAGLAFGGKKAYDMGRKKA